MILKNKDYVFINLVNTLLEIEIPVWKVNLWLFYM